MRSILIITHGKYENGMRLTCGCLTALDEVQKMLRAKLHEAYWLPARWYRPKV